MYRAHDTKLGRDVAVKVLPEIFASDPERLTRFQREAQVLASLNHPNIAAVYGLEESPSTSSRQAFNGDRKPFTVAATPFRESHGQLSPDGRSVAYTSNESGRTEMSVRPFPASSSGQLLVSSGGGFQPRWRGDGKELLYFSPDNKLISVTVTTAPVFKPGVSAALFTAVMPGGPARNTFGHEWDVSADGQRFLINTSFEETAPALTVLLNWQSGLPARETG